MIELIILYQKIKYYANVWAVTQCGYPPCCSTSFLPPPQLLAMAFVALCQVLAMNLQSIFIYFILFNFILFNFLSFKNYWLSLIKWISQASSGSRSAFCKVVPKIQSGTPCSFKCNAPCFCTHHTVRSQSQCDLGWHDAGLNSLIHACI